MTTRRRRVPRTKDAKGSSDEEDQEAASAVDYEQDLDDEDDVS